MSIATCVYTSGRIVESSEAQARLLGYASPRQIVGRAPEEFLVEREIDRCIRSRAYLRRGQWGFTVRARRADGSPMTLSGYVLHIAAEDLWVCTHWEGGHWPRPLGPPGS